MVLQTGTLEEGGVAKTAFERFLSGVLPLMVSQTIPRQIFSSTVLT